MPRLKADHHANGRVQLPPHPTVVAFDLFGVSDEVDDETARQALSLPGFVLHDAALPLVEPEPVAPVAPAVDAAALVAQCRELLTSVDDIVKGGKGHLEIGDHVAGVYNACRAGALVLSPGDPTLRKLADARPTDTYASLLPNVKVLVSPSLLAQAQPPTPAPETPAINPPPAPDTGSATASSDASGAEGAPGESDPLAPAALATLGPAGTSEPDAPANSPLAAEVARRRNAEAKRGGSRHR